MERPMGGTGGVVHGEGDGQEATRNDSVAGALTAALSSREYRRGNWTVPETMVLIEARRKVHEEERQPAGDQQQGLIVVAPRWRWVEDYCWRAGCRRSQNQCNDRWDNLMRDYKKVRAYELIRDDDVDVDAPTTRTRPSYWAMSTAERKEKGLPSNFLREIYDAMTEVVERKTMTSGGGGAFWGASSSSSFLDVPMQASPLAQVLPPAMPMPQERVVMTRGHGVPLCRSESPERKRRRASLDEQRPPGESSSSMPASGTQHFHRREEHVVHRPRREYDQNSDDSGGDDDEEAEVLSGAIGQCAAILSEALESQEAAEERRHREVMAVEERRGRALQARRRTGEQCAAGLAAAVNQLARSMLTLAAAKQQHKGGGPPPGPGPAAPN